MTLAAGTNSDDDAGGMPGTGLAPVAENPGIEQFLARMNEPETPRARSWRMRIFDYSAHAAMIAGLIGFAWTVSDHVVHRPSASPAGVAAASTPGKAVMADGIKPEYAKSAAAELQTAKADTARADSARADSAKAGPAKADTAKADTASPDEVSELRRTNARMAEDLAVLRSDLATLKNAVSRDQTRDQIRSLSASVDGVNSGLASARSETSAAIAKLTGKIDRMQRDTRGASVDTGATGSLPPKSTTEAKAAPLPPVKPAKLASTDERASQEQPSQKPSTIAGWSVLDVYEGVALVEGKRGAMEVMPGVAIPGAGIVRSIDRSGGGWTVTTTKGVIAFGASGRYARHVNTREPARGYRYDF